MTYRYCIYLVESDGTTHSVTHVDATSSYEAMGCARSKHPEYIAVGETFFAARLSNPNGEQGLFRIVEDAPSPPPVRIEACGCPGRVY